MAPGLCWYSLPPSHMSFPYLLPPPSSFSRFLLWPSNTYTKHRQTQGPLCKQDNQPPTTYFHNFDKLISLSSCLVNIFAVAKSVRRIVSPSKTSVIPRHVWQVSKRRRKKNKRAHQSPPVLRVFSFPVKRTFQLQYTHPLALPPSTHSFSQRLSSDLCHG